MPVLDEEKAKSVGVQEPRAAADDGPTLGPLVRMKPGRLCRPHEPGGDPPEIERVPWEDAVSVLARMAHVKHTWVIQGILPQFEYGTLAAEYGAGKTWLVLDKAVSVATGTPWLDCFPAGQGSVCLFFGEGNEHQFARRVRAICKHKGVTLQPGQLHVSFRPPRLSEEAIRDEIAAYLEAVRPVLVILDPLYLSQGGTSGRNLSEMGDLMASIQVLCQDAGATLEVVAHWNKSGQGNGSDRVTGTGLQEWSRVMINVSIEASTPPPLSDVHGTTDVTLGMVLSKGAEGSYLVRRRVQTRDRNDLDSPMKYEIWVHEYGGKRASRKDKAAARRNADLQALLDALDQLGPDTTAQAISEHLGKPKRTIQDRLTTLDGQHGIGWRPDPGMPQRRLYTRAP